MSRLRSLESKVDEVVVGTVNVFRERFAQPSKVVNFADNVRYVALHFLRQAINAPELLDHLKILMTQMMDIDVVENLPEVF